MEELTPVALAACITRLRKDAEITIRWRHAYGWRTYVHPLKSRWFGLKDWLVYQLSVRDPEARVLFVIEANFLGMDGAERKRALQLRHSERERKRKYRFWWRA